MDIANLREVARQERDRHPPTRIRCCTAAGCLSSGSAAAKQGLEAAFNMRG
ncbi:MAG: hypothetical protein ACFE0J_13640 [Elainellaceae cyanobacterium]